MNFLVFFFHFSDYSSCIYLETYNFLIGVGSMFVLIMNYIIDRWDLVISRQPIQVC